MSTPAAVARLASLVVDALELGRRKAEHDVAGDLFRAFGIDLAALEAAASPSGVEDFRREAAARLSAAVPSAEELLTAVVAMGARFVDMVSGIYEVLSEHHSTTSGTSEVFRLRRDGVDIDLPISSAFLEQVRALQRALLRVELAAMDERAVGSFVGWDGGELYGTWPIRDASPTRFRLTDAVIRLRRCGRILDGKPRDAEWESVRLSYRAASEAAGELVRASESLLVRYGTYLASVSDADLSTGMDATVQHEEVTDSDRRRLADDRRMVVEYGVLGVPVSARYYVNLQDDGLLGVSVARGSVGGPLVGVVIPARWDLDGTGIASLAGFVGLWRLAAVPIRGNDGVDALFDDPSGVAAQSWLERVRLGCQEATTWLDGPAQRPTGHSIEIENVITVLEEYLNLPLWRHRDLLYEVWLLCLTLATCRQAGWTVELRGLDPAGTVWALTSGPSAEPVADLTYDADPSVSAAVWREPDRRTPVGRFTPDVSIATVGAYPRELAVIEGKDRWGMDAFAPESPAEPASPRRRGGRSALDVGKRYADALRPIVTWVCNYCDFQPDALDPAANHGDRWSQIYIASSFRPKNLPDAFLDTIRIALTPPGARSGAAPQPASFLIVLDVTGSMERNIRSVLDVLSDDPGWTDRYKEFWAVLYSDHGDSEPFLTIELGPFDTPAELVEAIADGPRGSGGDEPEALEDALAHCAALTELAGPFDVLVVTDAPPHAVHECPARIDAREQVSRILGSGSRVFVASDWLQDDDTWEPFGQDDGVRRDLLDRLAGWISGSSLSLRSPSGR